MPSTTSIGTFSLIWKTSRREQLRAAAVGERTARHHEHIKNIAPAQPFSAKKPPIFPVLREKSRDYTDLSGTRPQPSNTGQSVCSHGARSSMRRPLQRLSPDSEQNRQIACWTNRGKLAENAVLKRRAITAPASIQVGRLASPPSSRSDSAIASTLFDAP